jgi:Tfp pilus assembly protein PilE
MAFRRLQALAEQLPLIVRNGHTKMKGLIYLSFQSAVSYLELLVVLVVIMVLGTISFQHYNIYRERGLDSEAQANLAAIVSAERDFRREQAGFFISGSEAALNANLPGVVLPTAAAMKWDYSTSARAGNPGVCCAQATRTAVPVRTWRLCSNEMEPVLDACGANAANCP